MSTLKNAKYVDPAEIYKYLVFDKGLSHYHAIGMINNIKYESSFNAAAIGDNGSSIGLFQHNTNRMNALKKFAGDDWTDWKKQIDYTLTEKDTEKYLQQKFDSPENASVWFTTNWERPANKEQKARTRAMTAGTYHNRFEGIDRWSRKPDDPFYGFDPQAKSFTVRDQWGRPPGDQWYGFDPNTNTWTRGSKAPKKTTTPAKGNNTSSNNTGWEEQTDNYWNNQTASYEEQDEETQEKQIEELLAEEVEKIEIIEEELALSPEMQILERKKQFLQEYSPEELEDTHIYAYEEQQSLPPPQNTPFQLDPSMLQASMPSLPKLFITDLEELEQNTFQYGGVFQDGGKMTKEEFEKRKAAYEKLTGRKLEPPKTFKPSEKARQQYQEKYNQQPVVQSQPSETVQQSRGMTADEVEQLKIQNAPLDPRINQFSFEADNRSEEQRQRDQEAASQLTDPTGWNQVANYLQAPLFQAGNFWNTISGGDDWEKAQQAYNLKQMNPYEQDKWQNFISTAGSNTAQGLMTGMEILDGYAIARALPGFGRQNISTKLLQKEGVDFNLPIKPLNSPKSYESFYTPWSNPNIKDLNKILDEIKDANTWQKEWYNHPHRTSILDKAERTFQREIEAGNKSLISEYKGENPFTKMKKRIERENYKAIGVSSKSPLVEDLFLNKQTLPGTTPFGVSGYRPKMGGERQNIVFVDVASPTRARSTAVHEGNHGLTDANTLIPKYYQEDMVKIFGKNTQVPLRTEKGFASYDDYLKNPTEIYARVAEMRQVFKIKPDRIISEEDAVKMLNHIKAKKTPLPPEFAKAVKDPKKLAQVMNYLPAIGVVIGTTTQFRDGGTFSEDNPRNAMIKARLAYEYQRGNPAVMRMMSGHDNPYQFEEGSTGTHYMASMDNYAVPLIQDENGNLVLGDYGPDSKEAIQFDSPEDAEYFAENYKYFAPALQNFQNGGTVSELYTQKTGLPWATAKEQGLTDGSYEANMQLRNKLLQENPQLQNYKPNNNQTPYQSTVRGMVAQGKTLDDLVSSKVGTREGLTNMFPDLFSGQQPTNTKPNPTTPPTQTQQPTEEVLYYKDRPGAKYVKRADGWYINLGDKTKNDFVRIDDPTGARTKELDKNATKDLPQAAPTGNKVKLKSRWADWEEVRLERQKINTLPQEDIIRNHYKNSKEEYLVLDKKTGKLKYYKGDQEIESYNVGVGENKGDQQTRTVVKDGKVLWDKGNKTTGAGVYTVSGVNSFGGAPSWTFKNEQGIEVPMALHASFGDRTKKIKDNEVVFRYEGRPESLYKKENGVWYIKNKDTKNTFVPIKDSKGERTKELDRNAKILLNEDVRLSNGCINGLCMDLDKVYEKGFSEGKKLYILPEEEDNRFKIIGGALAFQSKDKDVNRTTTSINSYRDIRIDVDKNKLKVFGDNAFSGGWDENQYKNIITPYTKSLSDNKKELMRLTGIDNDTYNDIAAVAFGILGVESNFGDTHSGTGNFFRAVSKAIDPKGSSSPDYKSKYGTYGQNKESNSVGLTQIRFNMLDESERELLQQIGITSNSDLLDPSKAAVATMSILIKRYQNQLSPDKKQDIFTNLPNTWNKRGNYAERVKTLSQFAKIKEAR